MACLEVRNTPGGTHGAENLVTQTRVDLEICAFRALKSVSVECGAAALEPGCEDAVFQEDSRSLGPLRCGFSLAAWRDTHTQEPRTAHGQVCTHGRILPRVSGTHVCTHPCAHMPLCGPFQG